MMTRTNEEMGSLLIDMGFKCLLTIFVVCLSLRRTSSSAVKHRALSSALNHCILSICPARPPIRRCDSLSVSESCPGKCEYSLADGLQTEGQDFAASEFGRVLFCIPSLFESPPHPLPPPFEPMVLSRMRVPPGGTAALPGFVDLSPWTASPQSSLLALGMEWALEGYKEHVLSTLNCSLALEMAGKSDVELAAVQGEAEMGGAQVVWDPWVCQEIQKSINEVLAEPEELKLPLFRLLGNAPPLYSDALLRVRRSEFLGLDGLTEGRLTFSDQLFKSFAGHGVQDNPVIDLCASENVVGAVFSQDHRPASRWNFPPSFHLEALHLLEQCLTLHVVALWGTNLPGGYGWLRSALLRRDWIEIADGSTEVGTDSWRVGAEALGAGRVGWSILFRR